MLAHTLIAGDTGSGKSWTENQIVRQLIKDGAELILIDPKLLELHEYKANARIYADNPADISNAVRTAYTIMSARNIDTRSKGLKEYQGKPLYVVIDEMLPISMTKDYRKNGTIYYLEQIAVLGRAARVFLIICTQKATRKNIPDLIKTSLHTRICMRQYDERDYRYVLDSKVEPIYAEYGECYLKTVGKPERIKSDDVVNILFGKEAKQ